MTPTAAFCLGAALSAFLAGGLVLLTCGRKAKRSCPRCESVDVVVAVCELTGPPAHWIAMGDCKSCAYEWIVA